jgi:hypothetical protein
MHGLWSESESQEIYPDSCASYTLHLQRISAAIHERDFSSSKWKQRLLGTFLTLQKAGVTRSFWTIDQAQWQFWKKEDKTGLN